MTSAFHTFDEIESLCTNAVAESLQLEFKEKEDPSTSALSRTDKKQIAEAVSSFANSDGGTIIFGVRSERRGDSDVASELKPIADAADFASNFKMVCSLNVSPSLIPAQVRAVLVPGSNDGFIVCEVVRSNARPHMSTAPGVHSYFRRSFQGNVPMTPTEVRDQILAVRDAILEPIINYPAGGMYSMGYNWVSGRTSVVLSLKNVGQALCRNPFLRVSSETKLHSNSATFDAALGAWKTTFPYGTLIHVDDQESCLTLAFHIAVRFDILHRLFEHNASDFTESVLVLPAADSYRLDTITDKVSLEEICLHLKFGAENAPATESVVPLTRSKIASGVLSQGAVRDFYMQSTGPWRSDLLQRSLTTVE
jgi:hypothetical protein